MAKQPGASVQPGLFDTTRSPKAPTKKRATGVATSKDPQAGKPSEGEMKPPGPRSAVRKRSHGAFKRESREAIPKTAADKRLQPKTICSVDFGTTFSGVAIVGSVNCAISDIRVLQDWADGTHYLEKVPSRIAYPVDNPGLKKITFGYEVTATMKSYTWTKLYLAGGYVDKGTRGWPLRGGKAGRGVLELPPGKTAEDVVVDYLGCLYDHIMRYLAEETPGNLLAERPVEFWLTKPACWDDAADALTRRCAVAAGFGTRPTDSLYLTSEPEAALLANLSTSIDKHEGVYECDMNVGVVDIGGGTTDINTLTVMSLDPLKTREACVGIGAKVGMTDVDFKLYAHCETSFGDSFSDLGADVVGPSSEFAQDFEVIKRSFDGENLDRVYRLRLFPLRAALEAANSCPTNYDLVEGKIVLTGADIRGMFDSVIAEALKGIDDQVAQLQRAREPLSVIVLVGGGGTSKYVISTIQDHCHKRHSDSIIVRRDERAWSAVSRGAAVRGLEDGVVVSRASTRAYGLVCHKAFDNTIDDEENSFVCPSFGKRGRDRMDWMLRRHDTIVEGMTRVRLLYISPNDMDSLEQYWDLFQCEDEMPPERLDDDRVEKIGRIKVSLQDVLARRRQRDSTRSGRQQPIRITLQLTLGSKIGVLEARAFHGRVEVGHAEIDYARGKGRLVRHVPQRARPSPIQGD